MLAVRNSHVQGRSATLFEFSLYDVILIAGVFILIVLYVALLVYLKPSLQTKRSEDISPKAKMQAPTPSSQEEESVEPALKPITAIEPGEEIPASREPSEEAEAGVEPTEKSLPTPPTEALKIEKVVADEAEEPSRMRGPPGPPGCTHYFGYLAEIPKNTPIPDGCLGCLRLTECLIKRPLTQKHER